MLLAQVHTIQFMEPLSDCGWGPLFDQIVVYQIGI